MMSSSSSREGDALAHAADPTRSIADDITCGLDSLGGPPTVCDAEHPVPFEELWLGFVAHAARALEPLIAPSLHAAVLHDPHGPLRSLLIELAEMGAPAAFELFALYRIREASAASVFGSVRGVESRDTYNAFVKHLATQQLSPLWDAFPALKPLLATRTNLFIAAMAELCQRWEADHVEIMSVFPELRGIGAPQRIRPGLSDAHGGGRTVTRLSFAGGEALFYKPRPVDMEWGCAQFVEWFNGQDHGMPPLRALSVLPRTDYGWMEAARPALCTHVDAVARFYHRAGMLLALADLFCGVDFHSENLIASGEYPVIVDLETLFHPLGPFESQGDALERTELLPRPIYCEDGAPYVICGLGVVPGKAVIELRRRGWININCDNMASCDVTVPWPVGGAVPRNKEGAAPSIATWSGEIVSGFSAMHVFFRTRRNELWSADGPIVQAFGGGRSRFLLRATRIYVELLRRAVQPQALAAHASSSHIFDRLARTGRGWDEIHRVERQALDRMDVPYFTMETTAQFVRGEGRTIHAFFATSGLHMARRRSEFIDDGILNDRAASIRNVLEQSSYSGEATLPDSRVQTDAGAGA